jgi:hypothetical protein
LGHLWGRILKFLGLVYHLGLVLLRRLDRHIPVDPGRDIYTRRLGALCRPRWCSGAVAAPRSQQDRYCYGRYPSEVPHESHPTSAHHCLLPMGDADIAPLSWRSGAPRGPAGTIQGSDNVNLGVVRASRSPPLAPAGLAFATGVPGRHLLSGFQKDRRRGWRSDRVTLPAARIELALI